MKTQLIIFLMLILLSITSCQRYGNIHSVTDPRFSSVKYQKICVEIEDFDLSTSIEFELDVVDYLAEFDCSAASSAKLMPPTRKWSDENKRQFLMQNGFDGYLVFIRTSTDISLRYDHKYIVKYDCILFDVDSGEKAWLLELTFMTKYPDQPPNIEIGDVIVALENEGRI